MDINKLLEAVLLAAIPILVPFAIKALRAFAEKEYALAKEAQPRLLHDIEWGAQIAVKAAEQLGVTKQLEALALSKKEYAIQYVQDYLNEKGFGAVNVKLIEGAIEAAVLEEDFPHAEQPAAK